MKAEDELEAWLRRHREVDELRARSAGSGLPDPSVFLTLSGLEVLQGAARGEIPVAPMERALSYHFLEVEHGRILFQGIPGEQFRNPAGTIHGGWYATLLDSCMTGAVYSVLPAGRAYATLEMSVNFVRALTPLARCVRAEGKVIHAGRQFATAEGRLYGPGDVLYAHGKTTCYLFDARPG